MRQLAQDWSPHRWHVWKASSVVALCTPRGSHWVLPRGEIKVDLSPFTHKLQVLEHSGFPVGAACASTGKLPAELGGRDRLGAWQTLHGRLEDQDWKPHGNQGTKTTPCWNGVTPTPLPIFVLVHRRQNPGGGLDRPPSWHMPTTDCSARRAHWLLKWKSRAF